MAGPQTAFPSSAMSIPNQIGFRNMQVVTSTQNWVVPAGVTAAKVTVVGGGAGATNGVSLVASAGAGGTAIKMITGLSSGQVIPLTVASSVTFNTAGQTSSFGAYCSATGGAINMTGGVGVGGDINIRGGSGANPFPQTVYACSTYYYYGPGGNSTHGGGGNGQLSTSVSTTGNSGSNYGGGGAAGGTQGGGGAQGVIIIEY